MKRKSVGYVTATVVVLGLALWSPQTIWSAIVSPWNRIPHNAGGTVEIETDMGMVNVNGRLKMVQQLLHELNEHPKAKRFRILSNWGNCGVSGKRVLVYNRSDETLQSWSESLNQKSGRRNLLRANYAAVTGKVIHAAGTTDIGTWYRKGGSRLYAFDSLPNYGCEKVE